MGHLDYLPGTFFGPSNLVALVQHRALHQPDDIAFTYLVDGETQEVHITNRELDRQARAIGAWLQQHRLVGERALLLYPAGLEFIAAFFGCLYGGVVAVPVYPPRRNRSLARIQAIANDAEAKVALTTQAVLDLVRPIVEETPDLKKLTWLATCQVPVEMAEQWEMPDVHGDTLAFLQYTSGSTGTPKGVMLNHASLLHNSALIAYAFEHTRSGIGVFWLPSYHDMGLIGGILQPLYMGRPNILMSPMAFLQRPYRWLAAITRYGSKIRGTVTSGGPNFAYDLCVEKISPELRKHLDLSKWGVAFNGSEPVRAETIERFCQAFAPCGFRPEAFYPCYGLAEATLIVSGGYAKEPPVIRYYDAHQLAAGKVVARKPGEPGSHALVGCGSALLDQRIVIADPETMTTAPPGRVGEIWVRGPSVALGYWRQPEATQATFQAYLKDTGDGPFLRTGDLGFIEDGELFVTGRIKDVIIIHGLNHYPQDIEATVQRCHPRLRRDCGAAFTVEINGREKLVIVQEVERRKQGHWDEIFQAIRRAVAEEHDLVVESILLLRAGSIPKTSSGKIQRHACRNGYLEGTLQVVARWEASEQAEKLQVASLSKPSRATPPIARESLGEEMGSDAVRCASIPDSSGLGGVVPGGLGASRQSISAEAPPQEVSVGANEAGFEVLQGDNGAQSVSGSRKPIDLAARQRIIQIVLEEVRRVARERADGLTLDSSILELGMDSIERMEIVASLEERFGGRFPPEILPDLVTCRQVVEAVEQYLGTEPRTAKPLPPQTSIPEQYYRFELFPEYLKLQENFRRMEALGVGNPYFTVHEGITNNRTIIGGREYINYSSYNYIGASGDPEVTRAAQEAAAKYGTSVSASRLVSGEKPLHRELERGIARLLGVEDAIVFVGGHATNETVIGHLFGPGDLILHDALAHNSILQGAILSGARRRPFPHNDWQAADEILRRYRHEYRRVLIVIEGVYSMDGDIPDLPRFIEVKNRHKAILMIDEAHSIGTIGPRGRGISDYFGIPAPQVEIWMGTLSKTFGSCGGYIAGSRALVEYLKYTAPGFVYSVGMPPPAAAAALAALKILETQPERSQRLQERAKLFLNLAKQRGLNTGLSHDSPVVPIILGNSVHCLMLSRALRDRGINVQPILYPAVEETAARLRFFLTCLHTEEQIRYTIDALCEELEKIRAGRFAQPTKSG
ncbi:MAG: aminotransferase class I/II-fold pyridoxal phosphate-dependent enzyme [Thermoguttaceae bacterium]|nr:aminotransferase class I/II-fold pyridoxal phosphate-dependent enzyme [Thermoguttaceae bacterium]MDW8038865.1 aminotransferase class I/II-fold pyridoxal phosphate-dependent enzyme [Thermoguttaceae bacterium]